MPLDTEGLTLGRLRDTMEDGGGTRPGVLGSVASQRVRHNLAIKQQKTPVAFQQSDADSYTLKKSGKDPLCQRGFLTQLRCLW